jgi:SAM-dependent methyltransferase
MPPRPHPLAVPRKPQGLPTRGKTARNRLRQVDAFALRYDPTVLTRMDGDFAHALYVDLGYGAEPTTTLESADRFRQTNPNLTVLGVEIDPLRVETALPFADERTFFRLGGFNLPLQPGETVRLIRALNVLRQYPEEAVRPAWEQMARAVLPDGLLLEGTSNPNGSLLAMNVLRRVNAGDFPWRLEALAIHTNFRAGFDPADFQAILPKNYIHRMLPGEPIYDFFESWKAAAAEAVGLRAYGPRPWFAAAAGGLARRGYSINLQRKWLGRGWLIWSFTLNVQYLQRFKELTRTASSTKAE